MVTPAGLKPATPGTGILCSIQLSYGAIEDNNCKSNKCFSYYKEKSRKVSWIVRLKDGWLMDLKVGWCADLMDAY